MNKLEKAGRVIKYGVMSSAVVLMAGAGLSFASYNGVGLSGLGGFGLFGNNSANEVTGPYSENKNITKIENETRVKLINIDEEDNDLDLYFNTGKNEVEKNTKVGNVLGGSVNVAFALTGGLAGGLGSTSVNDVYGFQNNVTSTYEDPSLVNAITGPYSKNVNVVKIDNDRSLFVLNKRNIDNDIDIKANTGKTR